MYRLRFRGRHVDLYENEAALPRAFFVPRIEVVADSAALLQRLANGSDEPTEVALVEEAPPSGFLGSAAVDGASSVEFTTDDPEHLVLRVQNRPGSAQFAAGESVTLTWAVDDLRIFPAQQLTTVPTVESTPSTPEG